MNSIRKWNDIEYFQISKSMLMHFFTWTMEIYIYILLHKWHAFGLLKLMIKNFRYAMECSFPKFTLGFKNWTVKDHCCRPQVEWSRIAVGPVEQRPWPEGPWESIWKLRALGVGAMQRDGLAVPSLCMY